MREQEKIFYTYSGSKSMGVSAFDPIKTHSFVLFISDMSLEQEITWNKMVSVNLYALGKKLN